MNNICTFLSHDEISTLTGRKIKSRQIQILRAMGLPFFINANGRPVVTRAAIHGQEKIPAISTQIWKPTVLGE